jgi:hypothetical protein
MEVDIAMDTDIDMGMAWTSTWAGMDIDMGMA